MEKRFPLFTGVLIILFLIQGSGLALAGTYVEQKVSSSTRGMNLNVNAWMDGDNGKVLFAKSDSDVTPKGSYLLTHDAGETVHLINPKKKTYAKWDMDAVFATLGQVMKDAEGVVDIVFKDATAEDLGTEPGGQILGVDTIKKSWRTGYTLGMTVVFMDQHRRMETTTDAWLSQDVSIPTLGNMWFAVNPPTTGNDELDFVLTESMKRVDGTPLKVVQRTKAKDKKGKGKTTKMTMEITELREETIAADTFAMPEDYKEVPLLDFGGSSNDNIEKDEADPLKNLGGLFGDKE